MLEELEAFRAAHDCEQFEWHEDEEENGVVFHCKGCGRKIEYEN